MGSLSGEGGGQLGQLALLTFPPSTVVALGSQSSRGAAHTLVSMFPEGHMCRTLEEGQWRLATAWCEFKGTASDTGQQLPFSGPRRHPGARGLGGALLLHV